jgi:hypothetical protein
MSDLLKDASGPATDTVENVQKTVPKPDPLRADFENKANKLAARKQAPKKVYDDYEDDDEDEDSDPEFVFPHREGKHRIVPVRTSRIADRPISDKDSTMRIKIELDLEVEVEIYARVKGDVTIGIM